MDEIGLRTIEEVYHNNLLHEMRGEGKSSQQAACDKERRGDNKDTYSFLHLYAIKHQQNTLHSEYIMRITYIIFLVHCCYVPILRLDFAYKKKIHVNKNIILSLRCVLYNVNHIVVYIKKL